MKLFECQICGQLVYFENTRCERCSHVLGYLSDINLVVALTPRGDGRWQPVGVASGEVRFCANAAYEACNWLVPADGPDAFCRACRLNRTIPDLGIPENILLWQRLEAAKHRLVYGLLRFGLPVVSKFDDPERGLAFAFLAGSWADAPVPTPHPSRSAAVAAADLRGLIVSAPGEPAARRARARPAPCPKDTGHP